MNKSNTTTRSFFTKSWISMSILRRIRLLRTSWWQERVLWSTARPSHRWESWNPIIPLCWDSSTRHRMASYGLTTSQNLTILTFQRCPRLMAHVSFKLTTRRQGRRERPTRMRRMMLTWIGQCGLSSGRKDHLTRYLKTSSLIISHKWSEWEILSSLEESTSRSLNLNVIV